VSGDFPDGAIVSAIAFCEFNGPYDAKVVGDYTGLGLRNGKLGS